MFREKTGHTLLFREWVFVCIVFFFGLLIVFSSTNWGFFNKSPVRVMKHSLFSSDRQKIQVVISGAVDRPGIYEVQAGSTVRSVLERAGIRSNADKKACYLKKTLLTSCEVHITEKIGKKRKKTEF